MENNELKKKLNNLAMFSGIYEPVTPDHLQTLL